MNRRKLLAMLPFGGAVASLDASLVTNPGPAEPPNFRLRAFLAEHEASVHAYYAPTLIPEEAFVTMRVSQEVSTHSEPGTTEREFILGDQVCTLHYEKFSWTFAYHQNKLWDAACEYVIPKSTVYGK